MPDVTDAATISLSKTLALLDGDFKSFADGIADGRYAFWLGSGISLTRFPGLKDLVEKVLEYLRNRADQQNEDCPFRRALDRAFTIAALSPQERAAVDLKVTAAQWPGIDSLKSRLAQNYSTFLNIDIDGEPADLLVWEGVGVVEVYGNPEVDPDAEHLALAVLIREGLATELASANWDGLVEKAVERISGGDCGIDVCVKSKDLQGCEHGARLVKFHGCAMHARDNALVYRSYIVGRGSQVDAWRDDPKMQGLLEHLRSVIIERPTLMLGLSAQDFNIRSLFGQAANALQWSWPGNRPAYVFSEDEISEGQLSLLQNVYRQHFDGEQRTAIKKSAHIKAFAKPLLCALILYAYSAKIERLSRLSDVTETREMGDWLGAGIKRLRNIITDADQGDHLAFLKILITQVSRAKSLLLSGAVPTDPSYYEPISPVSVANTENTVEIRQSGLGEAAVAAAILGAGVEADDWMLAVADPADAKSGIAVVKTPERDSRLFVVASAHAEHELFASGRLKESEDAILIHSQPLYSRPARSPRRAPGRTGTPRPRRVSIKTLLTETDSPEALMERFKMEVAV